MPEGSGRTGKPGNQAGMTLFGRTGTPGNRDGKPYAPKRPEAMVQSANVTGRSARPGNESSVKLPSRGFVGKSAVPNKGVPGRTTGKYTYRSKGLLSRG